MNDSADPPAGGEDDRLERLFEQMRDQWEQEER